MPGLAKAQGLQGIMHE